MAQDQITLRTATDWTTNWRTRHPELLSFLVPMEDLKGVIGEMGVGAVNARVYLGLTDSGEPKLVFVAANGTEQDIILNSSNPDAPVSGLYDFSNPCPPLCGDKTSPLYTGVLPE
ncbi:MAG: hypothetical protein WCR52_15665 [Bacteroidota bacterium]